MSEAKANGHHVHKVTDRLPPKVLQIMGIMAFIASVAFWMATDKQSVLMISASLSLIGVGSYTNQVKQLRDIIPSKEEVEA